MSIALFVDGESDEGTIPELIRKFLNVSPKIICKRMPRGDMFNSEKIKAHLGPLLKQDPDVAKVIVCVDSHCTDPKEIEEKTLRIEQELERQGLAIVPRYAVVVHALEGWLAVDSKALEKVLGKQVWIKRNLEEVCKPDDLLGDIFAQHGKRFQKTRHDPQIARYADPVEIARHSSSFRRFCQLVKNV